MGEYQISPDMIWYTCERCERDFTLADMSGKKCPHCSHEIYHHYVPE